MAADAIETGKLILGAIAVASKYGEVLENNSYGYGMPESRLPFTKDQIRNAIRILYGSLQEEKVQTFIRRQLPQQADYLLSEKYRNALAIGYGSLPNFVSEEEAELLENFNRMTDKETIQNMLRNPERSHEDIVGLAHMFTGRVGEIVTRINQQSLEHFDELEAYQKGVHEEVQRLKISSQPQQVSRKLSIHERLAHKALSKGHTPKMFEQAAYNHAKATFFWGGVAVVVWFFTSWRWALISVALAAISVVKSVSSTLTQIKLEELLQGSRNAKGTRSVPRDVPGAASTSVSFCTHCGNKIRPHANFCVHCGQPVSDVESSARQTVNDKTESIEEVGSITATCSVCGNIWMGNWHASLKDRQCPQCGQRWRVS